MTKRIVLLIGLVTILASVGLGPALAEHNSVGARVVVGAGDPTPPPEPDVGDDLRPVYHTGSQGGEFAGEFPRLSPADQSGLGLGDWIGYFNGVYEVPTIGQAGCLYSDVVSECSVNEDALYRVNPEPGDEECDELTERVNTTKCQGTNHPRAIDLWPPVRVRPGNIHEEADRPTGASGSGFLYPGAFRFYAFLFGEGTSGISAGEGAFEYLSESFVDECKANTASGTCDLITQSDLNDHTGKTRLAGDGETELKQTGEICLFAPGFSTLTGDAGDSACPTNARFQEYTGERMESGLYVSNQPGWYLITGYISFGSALSFGEVSVASGGTTRAPANIFHFYVNPVRVSAPNVCAAPPVSTNAPGDELDTGTEVNDDFEVFQNASYDYLLEAHDLDVYTAPFDDATTEVTDLVSEVINELDLPPQIQDAIDTAQDLADQAVEDTEAIAEPVLDEASSLTASIGPTKGPSAEPNADGDTSLAETGDAGGSRCDPNFGLVGPGEAKTYYNLMDARIVQEGTVRQANFGGTQVDTLKDPTVSEDGLPAEGDNQTHTPWHPGLYKFDGLLMSFLDGNENGQFDACPVDNEDGPDPDLCVTDFDYDMYESTGTIGEAARGKNYTDPTGLYFVLKSTGPLATFNVEREADLDAITDAQGDLTGRTQLLASQGQNCVVGTTVGLLDGDSIRKDRVATLLGAESTDEADVLAALCAGADGDHRLIKDAFVTQDPEGGTLNFAKAGKYASAVGWAPVTSNANATNLGPTDGLEVHAILTVAPDAIADNTAGELNLGADGTTATLAHEWPDRARSYVWSDVEPFASELNE